MSPTNLKCSLKKSFTTYLMINLLLSPHGREGPQLSEWPWWWHATSISSAALLTAHWHRSTTPGFGNLGLINGMRRRRLRQFWSSFSRSETVPAHRFPGCSASRWLLLVPLPVPIAQGQRKEFIQRELTLFIREEKLQMATSLLLTDPADEQGAQHAQPGKSRSSVCIALKGQIHKSKGRRRVSATAGAAERPEQFSLTEVHRWRRLATLSFLCFCLRSSLWSSVFCIYDTTNILLYSAYWGKQIRSLIDTSLTTKKLSSCVHKDLSMEVGTKFLVLLFKKKALALILISN